MFFFNLLRWVKSLRSRLRTKGSPIMKKPRIRLLAEQLETRLAPATFTWSGADIALLGPTFNNWSDGNNWVGGNKPTTINGAAPDLVFDTTAAVGLRNTTDDMAGLVVNSITISASGYTLGAGASSLTLGNPLVAGSGTLLVNPFASGEVISLNMQLNGPTSHQFFTIQQGSTLTISGQLSGAQTSSLTKEGLGTLVLTGNNSAFLGPVTIDTNAGIIDIQSSTALGDGYTQTPVNLVTVGQNSQLQLTSALPMTLANQLVLNGSGISNDGALLDATGNDTWTGTIALDSNTTFGAGTGTTLAITGVISDLGNQSITKEGLGTLYVDPIAKFSAANPNAGNLYHGNTNVNNGILEFSDPYALGIGDGIATVNSNVVESGTLALLFDAASNSPGGPQVASQYINLDPTQIISLNNPVVGTTTYTLTYAGATTLPITHTGNDSAAIQTALDNLATIGGIGGSVAVTLINPTTYSVSMQGSLVGLDPPVMTSAQTSVVSVAAGPVSLSGTTTAGSPVVNGLSSTASLGANESVSGPGIPVGTTIAAVTSATQITLSGNATVTGVAQLTFGSAPVGFQVPHEKLVLNGNGFKGQGTLENIGGQNTWAWDPVLQDSAITLWSSPNNVPISGNIFITVVGEPQGPFSSLTINAVIQDGGIGPTTAYSLSKIGTGRLILTNANTFQAGVNVLQGTLNVRDSQAMGTNPVLGRFVGAGASLELQADGSPDSVTSTFGPGPTLISPDYNLLFPATTTFTVNGNGFDGEGVIRNVTGVNKIEGQVKITNAAIGVDPDPDFFNLQGNTYNDLSQLTIDGVISSAPNASTLTKVGYGELVLTNTNTYSGPITGVDNAQTVIEQGWITSQNKQSLGAFVSSAEERIDISGILGPLLDLTFNYPTAAPGDDTGQFVLSGNPGFDAGTIQTELELLTSIGFGNVQVISVPAARRAQLFQRVLHQRAFRHVVAADRRLGLRRHQCRGHQSNHRRREGG